MASFLMLRGVDAPRSQIAIVDDDPAMRQAVARLCGAVSLPNRSYASAEEFLASETWDDAACLILDVQLPGLSGFELHDHLLRRGVQLPVVFITGQDQPHGRDRARKAGAAYLTKPFPGADLIEALRTRLPDPGDISPTPHQPIP